MNFLKPCQLYLHLTNLTPLSPEEQQWSPSLPLSEKGTSNLWKSSQPCQHLKSSLLPVERTGQDEPFIAAATDNNGHSGNFASLHCLLELDGKEGFLNIRVDCWDPGQRVGKVPIHEHQSIAHDFGRLHSLQVLENCLIVCILITSQSGGECFCVDFWSPILSEERVTWTA